MNFTPHDLDQIFDKLESGMVLCVTETLLTEVFDTAFTTFSICRTLVRTYTTVSDNDRTFPTIEDNNPIFSLLVP